MSISVKKVEFEDPESCNQYEVHYMVSSTSSDSIMLTEEDFVGDIDSLSIEGAEELRKALGRVLRWAETAKGSAKVEATRRKEDERERARMRARRAPAQPNGDPKEGA